MSGLLVTSPNFAFLAAHDALLLKLASQAELFCYENPDLCLTRLRQLAEAMATDVAVATGGMPSTDAPADLLALIRLLDKRGVMARETAEVFQLLRKLGNKAVHEHQGTQRDALGALKLALHAAVWYHRVRTGKPFKTPLFVPPVPAVSMETQLRTEVEELRSQLAEVHTKAQQAEALASDYQARQQVAEAQARRAQEDVRAAMALAEETEARFIEFQKDAAQVPSPPDAQVKKTSEQAKDANTALEAELDEADTRVLIDNQLQAMGWEADSSTLRYAKGARPEAGRNQAIAEWPTSSGPVDYALFVGLTAVGVIEAKKQAKNVPSVLKQAQRYARDLRLNDHATPPAGGPWSDYRVPFMFATNGRPFLRQLETMSGIWFLDGRLTTNLPRAISGWWTPEGLIELLGIDLTKATTNLRQTPNDLPGLRYYQVEAISEVEDALAKGQRDILLAMATGTGKTRTCLSLIYRLIRAKRFRRVLFLVDRTELGTQASDAFRDVKLEGLQSFSQIYDVKQIGEARTETETKVHIATVQSMVKRLLYPSEDARPFPVDSYDCIIVDECHRGYILDRELSENEIGFVSELDYQSKYRRVLDHFDAVRIGLTATPALHTNDIFGKPIYTYSYRRAVVDGYLIDHEPPHRIVTTLNKGGIHWKVGEEVKRIDTRTGEIDLSVTPDEIDVEVEKFNTEVITEPFNRAVCGELARHIDPGLPGKTLIFCADDHHADLVVKLLGKALADRYQGVHHDTVAKITGASDKPSLLVRKYKNEELPKIGVTVDLLSTGIDVPAIINLVFIRRIRSRILYEQMLGRATRLCPDLFGPGEDKQVFHIFDAVGLYDALEPYTSMHPVVSDPQLTIRQLADALIAARNTPASLLHFHEALVAKLNRKRRLLEMHAEQLQHRTQHTPSGFITALRDGGPPASLTQFEALPGLADWIDSLRSTTRRAGTLLSDHADAVESVERGYGTQTKPEDYLEGFGAWIRNNLNVIPALMIVTQRPRDLTRAQLRDLALKLDEAGYSQKYISAAWREARNEDIAAGIIGFIRAQALGSPLVPYEHRVDRAMQQVLNTKKYHWTAPQRQWLERIAKQLKKETIVDHAALNEGRFAAMGGFDKINPVFDGQLDDILTSIQEQVWNDAA